MSTDLLAASSITPKLLCSTRVAGTTATTVYTVPASSSVKITHGVLCNTSAAAVSVSLALVPSGGADDGTHTIISSYSLAAHDTLPLRDYVADAMLGNGDFVSITCSTGAVVDVVLSGAVSA